MNRNKNTPVRDVRIPRADPCLQLLAWLSELRTQHSGDWSFLRWNTRNEIPGKDECRREWGNTRRRRAREGMPNPVHLHLWPLNMREHGSAIAKDPEGNQSSDQEKSLQLNPPMSFPFHEASVPKICTQGAGRHDIPKELRLFLRFHFSFSLRFAHWFIVHWSHDLQHTYLIKFVSSPHAKKINNKKS